MIWDIDELGDSADWLRTRTWDIWLDGKLVSTKEELEQAVGLPFAEFVQMPAAAAMPSELAEEGLKHLAGSGAASGEPATKATSEEEAQLAAERRLLEALRVLMDKLRAEVAARLRSGVPITDKWLNEQFMGLLEPELTDIVVGSLQDTVAALGVDWAENFINAEAAKWARAYTFDLVKGLTETTRPLLQQATSTFFETPGMRIGDLEKLLEPAFGLIRAEMIATTETTRAFSAGKVIVQERLAESGIEMVRIWMTNVDELVCPICFPLNGQTEERWKGMFPGGPPAHPRCRCSTGLQIPVAEKSIKHLVGQHDQSTHAGRGAATRPTNEDFLHLRDDVPAQEFIARGDTVSNTRVRGEAKIAVVREISGRLIKDPVARKELARQLLNTDIDAGDMSGTEADHILASPKRIAEYASERRLRVAAERVVQDVLDGWAASSTDNSAHSIAVQRLAAKEFGTAADNLRKNLPEVWKASENVIQTSGVLTRRVLRHMYEHTQEELGKAGITQVVLFRGMHVEKKYLPKELLDKKNEFFGKAEAAVRVTANPISSYTSSVGVANWFAGNKTDYTEYPTMLAGVFPASRILATARTGIGCLNEHEFAVLDGPGKLRARVNFNK